MPGTTKRTSYGREEDLVVGVRSAGAPMIIVSSRIRPLVVPPLSFAAEDEVDSRLLDSSRVPPDPVPSAGVGCIAVADDDNADDNDDDAAAATFNCRVVTVVVVLVTGTALAFDFSA